MKVSSSWCKKRESKSERLFRLKTTSCRSWVIKSGSGESDRRKWGNFPASGARKGEIWKRIKWKVLVLTKGKEKRRKVWTDGLIRRKEEEAGSEVIFSRFHSFLDSQDLDARFLPIPSLSMKIPSSTVTCSRFISLVLTPQRRGKKGNEKRKEDKLQERNLEWDSLTFECWVIHASSSLGTS